ncbi:MAG: hypothetical protein AB7I29_13455 [Geobacter sp.]
MKQIILSLMLVVLALPASLYAAPRQSKNANPCPNGIETRLFFINVQTGRARSMVNPFDNVGRCFEIKSMDVLQIISRNKALCGGKEPFALVDFGKSSAPPNYFGGIVKGMGAFQYESAYGELVTVHHFRLLSDSEKNEAIRANRAIN